jgi:hypothetical protein
MGGTQRGDDEPVIVASPLADLETAIEDRYRDAGERTLDPHMERVAAAHAERGVPGCGELAFRAARLRSA